MSNVEVSSSSENETEKSADVIVSSKTQITEAQKLKFQNLKNKRIQLKEKYEKKYSKKLINQEMKINKEKVTINKSPIESTQILAHSSQTTQHSIDELEKNIDLAIKESEIEMAERLSNQLSSKQHEKKLNDALAAQKYQMEMFKKNLAKKRKKTLNWRFEPKQRWETKSNM